MYLLLGTMFESIIFIFIVGVLFRTQRQPTDVISDDVTSVVLEEEEEDKNPKSKMSSKIHPSEKTNFSKQRPKIYYGQTVCSFYRKYLDCIWFLGSMIFNTVFVMSVLLPILQN